MRETGESPEFDVPHEAPDERLSVRQRREQIFGRRASERAGTEAGEDGPQIGGQSSTEVAPSTEADEADRLQQRSEPAVEARADGNEQRAETREVMRERGEAPLDPIATRRGSGSSSQIEQQGSVREKLFDGSRETGRRGETRERERLEGRPELAKRLRESLDDVRAGVERWGPEDRARAEYWFGSADDGVRQQVSGIFDRVDAEQSRIVLRQFPEGMDEDEYETTYAYVRRLPVVGERHQIFIGPLFEEAEGPPNSQAGILVHEMSHFRKVGGSVDSKPHYGRQGSRDLAMLSPQDAVRTADNLEFFFEEYERDVERRNTDAR